MYLIYLTNEETPNFVTMSPDDVDATLPELVPPLRNDRYTQVDVSGKITALTGSLTLAVRNGQKTQIQKLCICISTLSTCLSAMVHEDYQYLHIVPAFFTNQPASHGRYSMSY